MKTKTIILVLSALTLGLSACSEKMETQLMQLSHDKAPLSVKEKRNTEEKSASLRDYLEKNGVQALSIQYDSDLYDMSNPNLIVQVQRKDIHKMRALNFR